MGLMNKILARLYGRMRSVYYQQRYDEYRELYEVSPMFGFNGTDIRLYGKGKIRLGANSYIGTNSTMQVNENSTIFVGSNCQISHNVRIYTSSHIADQDFTNSTDRLNIEADVIIGNGVWIGANVFINPGVTVGDNSVIGANSMVSKNVSANSIVGGVPARLIRVKNS